MNQVTNRVQFGLLLEEEKKQFCPEAKKRGLYKQVNPQHPNHEIMVEKNDQFSDNCVYQLDIESEEWYFVSQKDKYPEIVQGKEIHVANCESILILRPAKPSEKPIEINLKQRIRNEFPDYFPLMLEKILISRGKNQYYIWALENTDISHVEAQSITNFVDYVYEINKSLTKDSLPTRRVGAETVHPVACLFKPAAQFK